jgi:hypothetical protein
MFVWRASTNVVDHRLRRAGRNPTTVGTVPNNETSYPPPGETEVTETTSPEATLEMTQTPEVTDTAATDATQTPGVPVTGADVVLLEYQFCIEGMAQVLLVLPDTATFEIVADTGSLSTPGADTGCNTVDTFNGRQIVICRGAENTSLNLNICLNGTNCTQLLVELQDCPDPAGATVTPGLILPTDTPSTGATDTPEVLPTNSPNAGGG